MALSTKELKELADKHKIKIPSTITTNEVRTKWLKGAIHDLENGVAITPSRTSMSFDDVEVVTCPRYLPNDDGWVEHLHKHGWAVVQDVWSDDVNTAIRGKFWKWLARCKPQDPVLENDPSTWTQDRILVNHNGVFKTHIGHEDFVWEIRQRTKCIFDTIWQTKDIVTSFDGGSFLIPTPNAKTFTPWLHFDQPRDVEDFVSVQGIAHLTDSLTLDDGGFCFFRPMDKTVKQYFMKYMRKHQSYGYTWYKVNMEDPMLKEGTVCKVAAPKRSVVLFDSRLMHMNIPSRKNYRMVVYTSFQPRANVGVETHKKRQQAFDEKRMTGHWVSGDWFTILPRKAYNHGKPTNEPKDMQTQPDYEDVAYMV